MYNQKILEFIDRRSVTILLPQKESYGVRVFCLAFKAELELSGVDAHLESQSPWSVIKSFWADPSRIFVLNLQYLPWSIFFRNRSIVLIHGFPVRSKYRFLRYWKTVWATWLGCKFSGLVIANSGLTREINENFFSIPSDVVWNPNITSTRLIKCVSLSEEFKPSLLFAGRISLSKGFEKLISHIDALGSKYSKITIIGPDPQRLTKKLKKYANVSVIGSIAPSEVYSQMQAHDIFVSLNFLEPYGLVYQEAENAGCIVVCPFHTGFSEVSRSEQIVRILSSSEDDINFSMKLARDKVIKAQVPNK